MAISGWGVFLVILVVALVAAAGGYIGYTRWRANRLGLPPPSFNPFAQRRDDATYRAPTPRSGGPPGWISDKWNTLQNKFSLGGAYETTGAFGGPSSTRGGRRGFGPLDPDEAWDARVDHEASGYYEEQELGLQDPDHGPYGGHGYAESSSNNNNNNNININVGLGGMEAGRGRSTSRQRALDDEEVLGGDGAAPMNPFGDHNAEPGTSALRSVTPIPDADTAYHGRKAAHQKGSADGSPTERRSMFTEDV